jgi:hypothetical protein
MALQGKHHAGEKSCQPDDRQGKIADIHHLPAKLAQTKGWMQTMPDGNAGKYSETSSRLQKFEKRPAYKRERIHGKGVKFM